LNLELHFAKLGTLRPAHLQAQLHGQTILNSNSSWHPSMRRTGPVSTTCGARNHSSLFLLKQPQLVAVQRKQPMRAVLLQTESRNL